MNGPSVIYNYGFLFTYGIGFGFPLLLGLPDEKKSCGRHDFLNTLAQYDLQVNFYQILTLWPIETQSGTVYCDTKKNNLAMLHKHCFSTESEQKLPTLTHIHPVQKLK